MCQTQGRIDWKTYSRLCKKLFAIVRYKHNYILCSKHVFLENYWIWKHYTFNWFLPQLTDTFTNHSLSPIYKKQFLLLPQFEASSAAHVWWYTTQEPANKHFDVWTKKGSGCDVSVTVCAGVRRGPGSDLNRMALFIPKFKPEVRDSTVQKPVANKCPVIRRVSAMGVRLAEVQWGISRVVVKKPIKKSKQGAGKNRGWAKTKASRQSESLR